MGQKIIFLFILSIFSSACNNDSKTPLLMEKEKPAKVFSAKALPPQQTMKTQVDVVFVLDNSKSMKDELDYLKTNSHMLTQKLKEFSQIDAHIGVLQVFDSSRYTNNQEQSNGVLKIHPETGDQQYFDKGEFVTLTKGSDIWFLNNDQIDLLPSFFDIEVPFIARKKEITVDGKKEVEYPVGPEIEEAFSPLTAAIKKPKNSQFFFRKEALLVVIFVTDAETGSIPDEKLVTQPELKDLVETTDPVALYNQLLVFKGGRSENLLAYGVLCEVGDILCQNKGIEKPAYKIREFINLVHDQRDAVLQSRLSVSEMDQSRLQQNSTQDERILNLRSENWGEKLAHIGQAISRETLLRPIALEFVPEIKCWDKSQKNKEVDCAKSSKNVEWVPEIQVKMGSEKLEYKKHWLYDAADNSLTLLPSVLDLKAQKGQNFAVTGVAVDTRQKERAKSLSL